MKVCFVTREYPPRHHPGGIGTRFQNLAKGLADHGHRVHVLTRCESDEAEQMVCDENVTVHKISLSSTRVLPGVWRLERFAPQTISNLRYSWKVFWRLRRLVQEERIDVVISAAWGAETFWYVLLEQSAPLVVTVSGGSFLTHWHDKAKSLDYRLFKGMERVIIRHAHALHSVSKWMAERTAQDSAIPLERIRCIYTPVNSNLFRANGREANVNPEQSLEILFVGRIEERKGVEVLAKAIPLIHQRYPRTRFIFIGSGQTNSRAVLQRMRDSIGSSGDRVAFLGSMPHEALVTYYQQSSVCVFPSLEEPFANVCLEAMACAKAVIATSGTGFGELIDSGVNGMLVRPGDAAQLAAQVCELLQNTPLRLHLGRRARATIEQQFTLERIVPQWIEFLTTCLNDFTPCQS